MGTYKYDFVHCKGISNLFVPVFFLEKSWLKNTHFESTGSKIYTILLANTFVLNLELLHVVNIICKYTTDYFSYYKIIFTDIILSLSTHHGRD